jgi:glyoxylase-like metal-dependent hydrolase (beta-lactamase superfamily II)
MHVGSLEILPVVDGIGRVTPAQLYAAGDSRRRLGKGLTDVDWEPHRDLLDPEGRLEMPVRSFVVQSGGRVLVIDLGFGPDRPPGMPGGELLESLRTVGIEPDDVTDVVLTHLHNDHIGWASTDAGPTFPHATYRCDARDWDHFVAHGDDADRMSVFARSKLAPIEERFDLWDSDWTVVPGVDVVHAPGHTPGNTLIVFSSGTDRAMLLGDVVHCPVQLLDEEWARVLDVDEDLAQRTMARVLREIEAQEIPVTAAHFPGAEFGRVLVGHGKRQWVV